MRKATPLRNLRRARTLNQANMAGLIGVTQQTWSKYESGVVIPPKDVQVRIAAILGAGVDECFPPQVIAVGEGGRHGR
jgi:transcriptional regulator with XRE-family HTH domain